MDTRLGYWVVQVIKEGAGGAFAGAVVGVFVGGVVGVLLGSVLGGSVLGGVVLGVGLGTGEVVGVVLGRGGGVAGGGAGNVGGISKRCGNRKEAVYPRGRPNPSSRETRPLKGGRHRHEAAEHRGTEIVKRAMGQSGKLGARSCARLYSADPRRGSQRVLGALRTAATAAALRGRVSQWLWEIPAVDPQLRDDHGARTIADAGSASMTTRA